MPPISPAQIVELQKKHENIRNVSDRACVSPALC